MMSTVALESNEVLKPGVRLLKALLDPDAKLAPDEWPLAYRKLSTLLDRTIEENSDLRRQIEALRMALMLFADSRNAQ
jgi:hypothetical protein